MRGRFVTACGVLAMLVVALSVIPVAGADFTLVVDQKAVRVGGYLTGLGNGEGMPVFLVPVAIAPRPFACGRNTICTPQSLMRPGPPNYTLLGLLRTQHRPYTDQRFRFHVPRVKRGDYKVVFWCRRCGGSLILAGGTIDGQTVLVR